MEPFATIIIAMSRKDNDFTIFMIFICKIKVDIKFFSEFNYILKLKILNVIKIKRQLYSFGIVNRSSTQKRVTFTLRLSCSFLYHRHLYHISHFQIYTLMILFYLDKLSN